MSDVRVPASSNNRIECRRMTPSSSASDICPRANDSCYATSKTPRRIESNGIGMRSSDGERCGRWGLGNALARRTLCMVVVMAVMVRCDNGGVSIGPSTTRSTELRGSYDTSSSPPNTVLRASLTRPLECDSMSQHSPAEHGANSDEMTRSNSTQIDCSSHYFETAIRHPEASTVSSHAGDNGQRSAVHKDDEEPEVLGLNTVNVGIATTPEIPDSKPSEMHRRAVIDETSAGPAGGVIDKSQVVGVTGHTVSAESLYQHPTAGSVAPKFDINATTTIATTSSDDGNDNNAFSTVFSDGTSELGAEYTTEYDLGNLTTTPCTVEEEGISCTIDHNVTCVGDPIYCNYTQEEYMDMLYDYIYPTLPEWILIFSHAVVFFMGLVGNALVCIAVYTNYTMRTVTNIFIVNLAVADFFVILFCLPPTVVWDVTETWFMGKALCKVVMYFQTVSITVSVLTLTFISIDRWYAICFPLRYVSTNVRALGSIGFIWAVALLSDIPEFVYSTTKMKPLRFNMHLFTQCVSTWDKNTEKWFYIGRFVLLYILPLLMMTVAYFQIVRVLWKSDTIPGHRESRNTTHAGGYLRSGQSANASTMGQLRARRKAAKMLVAVVVMFASCFLPVHALNILRYTIDIGQTEVVTVLSLFSHWLCYANSAINPVIYNFMSGKFRREFRNALEKCRCGRARIEDRSLYHSTPASRMHNISPSSRSNYQLTSLRDMTSMRDRQTFQTSFVENGGLIGTNGHHHNNHHHLPSHHHQRHVGHNHHHHQAAQIMPMLLEDRLGQTKFDANP